MEAILKRQITRTRSVLDTELDQKRKKQLALEYLTHLQEIKEWIEEVLSIDLGSPADLGISLQNGVVLAKIALKFSPQFVGQIVTSKILSFKHTDNINYFLEMQKFFKIPDIIFFEVNDLYSLSNLINVVYSIYFTAVKLNKKGLAPPVKSLSGKVKFTQDEEKKAMKQLEKADVSKIEKIAELQKPKKKEEVWNEFYQEKEKISSLITIQSICKTLISKNKLKTITQTFQSQKNQESIKNIQKFFKQYNSQKKLNEKIQFLNKNEENISKIQQYSKGFIEQKQLNEKMEFLQNKEQEITKIQQFMKAFLEKKKLREKMEMLKKNQEEIIANEIIEEKEQEEHKNEKQSKKQSKKKKPQGITKTAAIIIQKNIRRKLIQRESRRKRRYYRSQKNQITKIQKFYNQKIEQNEFMKKREAAITIQKMYRGYAPRKIKRTLTSPAEMTLEDLGNVLRMFRVRASKIYDNEKIRTNEKIKMSQEEDLTELREAWVKEIRQTHDLQSDVQKLDRKISLLVKNRLSIEEIDSQSSKQNKHEKTSKALIPPQYLIHYQYLFYLLQTEPKYLARTLFYIRPNELEGFVQTMILTLYGYAFSPREEYLLLRLFTLSIREQIFKQKKASEFTKDDPIITKMFVFYFRRVQYQTFLKELLEPVIISVLKQESLVLELNTSKMYRAMINSEETRTGEKTKLAQTATHNEALKHQAISEIYNKNLRELTDICRQFVTQISKSIHTIPYGIRFICKAVKQTIFEKFPDTKEEEISKIIGYIIYYRYLIPAIIQPDSFDVVSPDSHISITARQNLALISKVIQSISTRKLFEKNEEYMMPLNDFISELSQISFDYFNEIPNVLDLEEQLQIDSDYELTQQKVPSIFISTKEIFFTHQILKKFTSKIAPDKGDPIHLILDDLKDVKIPDNPSEYEIELVLLNKFKTDAIKDTESQNVYDDTKKFIKDLLAAAPPHLLKQSPNLFDLIFNEDLTQNILQDILVPLRKNISFLEEKGVLNKADHFKNLIKEIVQEIRNASKIYHQNQVEIARLKKNLSIVRQSAQYLQDQMNQYNDYLDSVRKKQYEIAEEKSKKNLKKKKSEYICGPVTKKYKVLFKANIISSSDIPKAAWRATSFVFTSKKTGIFEIEARFAGTSFEKIKLDVEELLELQSSGKSELNLDRITLNINLLIHFLNKMMLK
ncbi:patterned expression site [Anaeramoeba ignava]|uniref:Patterned expression site n=1 Tax=Anaeramoeba ignava TaxID=1746090 RepID=A0A9Q0LMT9_ANAIG|nr:patterned expression site [Anaeramoeba ignava]